jgi:hypothetical protein
VAEVRNIHGIGRYIDGTASGEVFVDFGEIGHPRHVRINGRQIWDTAEPGTPDYQPQD